MFNLIHSSINYYGMFYSILTISFLCISLCIITYYNNFRVLSFFLLYISLTYGYFFIILTEDISSISVTYCYYNLLFLSYHFYFTLSKIFCNRTIIIIKKYSNDSNYFKLILWIILVFIPTLFGKPFVFLFVFNPLFAFSLVIGNFALFFFLFIIWSWMFLLIFCNKFNLCNNFLLKIKNYFSRQACLHFIGNSPGKQLCQQLGTFIVCTPIVVSIPATAGYILDKESQTGNYAIGKMHDYQSKYPNSTHNQQYKIYQDYYKSHANSSIIGRGLSKWGFLKPGAPEAIIPGYESNLKKALSSLESGKKGSSSAVAGLISDKPHNN